MITKEFKQKLISERLIPGYREIAKECAVSINTVQNVLNGSTANTEASRKVEEYIRTTATDMAKKNKAQEKLIGA